MRCLQNMFIKGRFPCIHHEQVEMISPTIPNTQDPIQRTLGQKQYEIRTTWVTY